MQQQLDATLDTMRQRVRSTSRRTILRRRYAWAYLFIVPQAILFFTLTAYPIVMSYVYSFFNWTGLGPINNFIGLGNYVKLFHDPLFWRSFVHTLEYLGGEIVLVIPARFVLAVLLNHPKFRAKGFYRVLYFIPVVTTTAIIGVVMQMIFSSTNSGFVNSLLTAIHISSEAIPWLSNPTMAMALVIVIGSWKYTGVVMIYWLAGLQTVSGEIYEAAELDGANGWKKMYYITLPLLKPISVVILLFTIVNGIAAFDLITTLTGGGPFYATQTLDVYVYDYAFNSGAVGGGLPEMGYASAGGVCLGLFVSILCLIVGWFVRLANRDR